MLPRTADGAVSAKLQCFRVLLHRAIAGSLAAVVPTPSNRSAGLDVFGLGSAVETVTSSAQKMLSSTSDGPSDWQVKADNPNLQNASRLLATLKSTISFYDLIFECKNGVRQASLSTTAFLGWEDVRDRYHINAGPETEARWPVAPNGRTVAIPEGVELLNSLTDGQTLVVTLTDYSSVEQRFSFEVSAVSGLRAQIETVCHSSVTSNQAKRVGAGGHNVAFPPGR